MKPYTIIAGMRGPTLLWRFNQNHDPEFISRVVQQIEAMVEVEARKRLTEHSHKITRRPDQ